MGAISVLVLNHFSSSIRLAFLRFKYTVGFVIPDWLLFTICLAGVLILSTLIYVYKRNTKNMIRFSHVQCLDKNEFEERKKIYTKCYLEELAKDPKYQSLVKDL